jgi:hypothetical protein
MAQLERSRGDLWAAKLRRRGCWVEKMQPPPTGMPDWLVSAPAGLRLVEAKTLEAVQDAEECRPWCACSGAQQFMLRMLHEHGGQVSVLVVGPDGYVECDYGAALAPMSVELFKQLEAPYDG